MRSPTLKNELPDALGAGTLRRGARAGPRAITIGRPLYLDKLVDELAKVRPMDKILRT